MINQSLERKCKKWKCKNFSFFIMLGGIFWN